MALPAAAVGRQVKIGLYSPFFGTTIGGGEKYLGVTAELIRDAFPGNEVEILSPVPADAELYRRLLGLDLAGIRLRALNPAAGSGRHRLARVRSLRRFRDLAVSRQVLAESAGYDLFLSMVYVLPAVTRAHRSVILCQFPYPTRPEPGAWKATRQLPHRVIRRLVLGEEVNRFQQVICQSEYVRGWVRERWGRDALVVNPPIDVPAVEPDLDAKRPVVLSVGRFFVGGHAKRQDLMVEAFRALCDSGLEGWELHLAGTLNREHPADVEYHARVCERSAGYPIVVRTDLDHGALDDLYARSSIYWHAAGFGAENRDPAELEHFGMTTAEAMSHGCVPVAVNLGGQPEVVGEAGVLWDRVEELVTATRELAGDAALRRRLALAARARSQRFSRAQFRRRMLEALAPEMEAAAAAL